LGRKPSRSGAEAGAFFFCVPKSVYLGVILVVVRRGVPELASRRFRQERSSVANMAAAVSLIKLIFGGSAWRGVALWRGCGLC
jgi:hypothetical protein